MNKEILTKAKNNLAVKRRELENQTLQLQKLCLADKEFNSLYKDYVSCMIEEAKFGKNSPALEQKKKAYENWLTKHDYSFINKNYSCKKCEDKGYIDGIMCDCLKKEITKVLIEQSGFTNLEDFSKADFSKFEKPEEMKKLYKIMQEWCNQKKHTKTLIFLSGQTGVGKTHLTKCMANELIKNSKIVNLTTAFAMNQELTSAFSSFDNFKKEQALQKYLDCEYLFIDDLGTEVVSSLTIKMLYLVLNERKMRGLSTIITTNLDLQEIRDQYDERIASRIIDKTTSICVRLTGNDLRLKR